MNQFVRVTNAERWLETEYSGRYLQYGAELEDFFVDFEKDKEVLVAVILLK